MSRRRPHGDDGSAIVEFFWLALLLMIPLVYLVLTAAAMQRSAFAVTQAAEQAARAYATAGGNDVGQQRAKDVVTIALRDQGERYRGSSAISCGSCRYEPGSSFTAQVSVRVPLPLIPTWLCGHACVAGVKVEASHTQTLGCFIGTGVAAAGSAC